MTNNPMVETPTENKSYINTTRDILTASKIKLRNDEPQSV